MTTLGIQHIAKSYDHKQVLDDVDVEVAQGELVSLLGPSGCGKTTTLNVVAGFVQPDSGQVLLGGKDITEAPPYRRDSAIVFQNYALFPHMRVTDNVAYGLRARRLPRNQIANRVRESLDLMGIAELADRYPAQLSGGQQQRVAVARAVAVQPGVLLMDEPLSNLDAKLRAEIRLELRALQLRLGQTVLFVTHDQEEALAISDRVAVINAGRIEQLGAPDEVFERPATTFVADFMGVENIFRGERDGTVWRGRNGLDLPLPERPDTAYVGIRPAQVRLENAGQAGLTDHEARLPVTVTGRAYLGDTVRYSLRCGETDLVAVAQRGSTRLSQGEDAVAIIAADDLLPLQASGNTAAADTDVPTPENPVPLKEG
ncbi:MAG: ABC transporter ATP-binding protein [Streptosporangiales bacterium]